MVIIDKRDRKREARFPSSCGTSDNDIIIVVLLQYGPSLCGVVVARYCSLGSVRRCCWCSEGSTVNSQPAGHKSTLRLLSVRPSTRALAN